MSTEEAPSPARRPRGRPKSTDRRDIANSLMDAAELLMKNDGLSALTEKRIAALAGVSEPTIPYYFGDKNGLLYAVVDRFLSFIEDRLSALMLIDPASTDASQQFARLMIEGHHTRPWIARIMTSEQQRHSESPIWHWYSQRRGSRSLIQIRDALCRQAQARYGTVVSDEAYATRIALSLFCVTTGTLSTHTLTESLGIRLEDIWEPPWLEHVTNLVNFHIHLLGGGDIGKIGIGP